MILQQLDLTERIHKESLLEKIKSDEHNFTLLLEWSLSTEQPLGWRATWLLRQLLSKNDLRLSNQIGKVLENFDRFNESQKREWLKTLEKQQVSEDQEGVLFDLCLSEWQKINNHPALRASAIQVIFKILKKYPELKEELSHVMSEEYLASLSPGICKGVVKSWQGLSK